GVNTLTTGGGLNAGQASRLSSERLGASEKTNPPWASYVFSLSTNVSLSPRGTSAGRVGEGGVRASLGNAASSPRPSPPSGEERERRTQCKAKHVLGFVDGGRRDAGETPGLPCDSRRALFR